MQYSDGGGWVGWWRIALCSSLEGHEEEVRKVWERGSHLPANTFGVAGVGVLLEV